MRDRSANVSLRAVSESWDGLSRDPALPGLVLRYGEEYGVCGDPDWSLMAERAAADLLWAFTLRASSDLVGACVVEPMKLLTFKGKWVAWATFIYVEPEWRGKGTELLLLAVKESMGRRGAASIALHHAMTSPVSFPPLGEGFAMRLWAKDL